MDMNTPEFARAYEGTVRALRATMAGRDQAVVLPALLHAAAQIAALHGFTQAQFAEGAAGNFEKAVEERAQIAAQDADPNAEILPEATLEHWFALLHAEATRVLERLEMVTTSMRDRAIRVASEAEEVELAKPARERGSEELLAMMDAADEASAVWGCTKAARDLVRLAVEHDEAVSHALAKNVHTAVRGPWCEEDPMCPHEPDPDAKPVVISLDAARAARR